MEERIEDVILKTCRQIWTIFNDESMMASRALLAEKLGMGCCSQVNGLDNFASTRCSFSV